MGLADWVGSHSSQVWCGARRALLTAGSTSYYLLLTTYYLILTSYYLLLIYYLLTKYLPTLYYSPLTADQVIQDQWQVHTYLLQLPAYSVHSCTRMTRRCWCTTRQGQVKLLQRLLSR